PVAAANTSSLKREPRGNKEPYSDAAYARLQNPGAAPVVVPAVPGKPAENKQAAEAKPEPDNKAASSTEAAVEGVTWSWPAAGKVVGNFSQTKGVDIAGKAGDPVQAAADGKVVYSGSGLRGYGQLVIIKHNGTFLSAYAHNQKILVKEGQSVKRGQKIAEMGNTDSDSVKLHFEVRRQGKPVEPLEFLPKR
ncbi:peptidoglycan DD-metalloendopeptidase family protein, partial [Azovibrio restrictus]|uniref:peptidoglycan DD-metalloendopeptidase family protein n=1 Tax=Azovibrio restrictus TaxID=146938 RepID=UPI0026EB9EDA